MKSRSRGTLADGTRNRKTAWVIGGLLFLVASGLVGVWTGKGGFAEARLARIDIEGPILSAKPTVDLLERVQENEAIKGALLRIESPGGGVGASEEIYGAVRRLAESKPVAVSMGSVAASGGYLVALGGDRLFALDSTLTGSIGVIMISSNLEPLLDKIGIEPRIIKSGPYKDAGTPFREMSKKDRAYLQSVVDELYQNFVKVVAKERPLDREAVRKLADGRVYSGRQAYKEGLVDALGNLHTSEHWLRKEAGVGKEVPLQELFPADQWLRRWFSMSWIRWFISTVRPRPQYFYLYSG